MVKRLIAALMLVFFCLSIASCYFPGRGGGGHRDRGHRSGGQHHDGGHRGGR